MAAKMADITILISITTHVAVKGNFNMYGMCLSKKVNSQTVSISQN